MRRSLHPTARKGRETKWEMMRLWGEESRKLKAGGRREVKHCQAVVCCLKRLLIETHDATVTQGSPLGTIFIVGTAFFLKVTTRSLNHTLNPNIKFSKFHSKLKNVQMEVFLVSLRTPGNS